MNYALPGYLALLLLLPPVFAGECHPSLDRPYTLANPIPHALERERGEAALGLTGLSGVLPRPGGSECPDGPAFPAEPWLRLGDSTGRISALPMGGQEFRHDGDALGATEAGVLAAGRKGPVSFRADARTYVEMGGDPRRPSYDREIIDDQSGEVSGSVDYRSYSRFRGDLALVTSIGDFAMARDAVHWGPALFENLTFSRDAVPFHYYYFTTSIGSLRVASLYGDLLIGDNQGYSTENRMTRGIHAHRYELSLGSRWQAGITEQLVLYDMEKAYLMAPVFPLFIAKGFLYEDNTNGAIAFDLIWRSGAGVLLYGEFLLDDLESPSSLFTRDYIQNKWGAMAGIHWAREFGSWMAGTVAELSHLEPWVYAHFDARTAQFSNLGRPLGNPSGPDSRNFTAKIYARKGNSWYAGVKLALRWKGTGPGAHQENPVPETPLARQESLNGEGSPDGFVEPEISWTGTWLSAGVAGRLGEDPMLRTSLRIYR